MRDRSQRVHASHRGAADVAGAIAVVAVVALFVTPAFGRLKALIDAPPPDPLHKAVQAGNSQQVVSLTLKNLHGKRYVFWTSPSPRGGVCEFEQLADASAPARADANAGGICDRGPQPASLPIGPTLSWTRTSDGSLDVLVSGHVAPRSGIRRIVLEMPSGAASLPLVGGYFIGELSETSDKFGAMPSDGSYALVGYDALGAQVASLDLNKFNDAATPH